ncbi:hypothetical protein KC221_21210, partial [Mycobacterium tuberculosis]|nr:hypothetical protein [Mycobacterium tuberculosis]
LSFAAEDLPIALDSLKAITQGAVILSTCNRTESYALAPEGQTLTSTMSQVIEWLAALNITPMQNIAPHLYQYQNNHALLHWVRVASGLDSMLLGESQIWRQLKQAVRQSRAKEAISRKLSWVIPHV